MKSTKSDSMANDAVLIDISINTKKAVIEFCRCIVSIEQAGPGLGEAGNRAPD